MIKNTLNSRFKKLSKRNFERALRIFYNHNIVNAEKLPDEIEFENGLSISDYRTPKSDNRVDENFEISEEEEKHFMEAFEREREQKRNKNDDNSYESIESIMEYLEDQEDAISVHSSNDCLAERVLDAISGMIERDTGAIEHHVKIESSNSLESIQAANLTDEENVSDSSDEPELIEDEQLGKSDFL